MNTCGFATLKLLKENLFLPTGGFDPGPAPDGPTKLPYWPSTQPCRVPVREKFGFQTKAGY